MQRKSHIYAFYEVKIFFPFSSRFWFFIQWKHKSQFSSHKKRYGSTFKTSERMWPRLLGHKFELSSINAFFLCLSHSSFSLLLFVRSTLDLTAGIQFALLCIYGINIFELSSVAFLWFLCYNFLSIHYMLVMAYDMLVKHCNSDENKMF